MADTSLIVILDITGDWLRMNQFAEKDIALTIINYILQENKMFMKKENYEAWMREQNKNLQKQGVRVRPPVCPECGEQMINAVDSITKKISKYLWKTNCGHFKGKRLSIG